jgi:thiamine pyrophosphate-dependent acetolactate synthase large subunit-like protein
VASDTVSTFMLKRMLEWGVNRVYAYPGDGSNGLDLAFADVPELEFVQTRHEEIASFAATAHAKLTGEVGVCLATSGPGAVHLLNGLYDAKLDHAPVVAIVGQQARMSLGASYQQEIDLGTLYKDVAHEYVEVCMDPRQAAHLIDRAIRIAISQRTVTAIIVPNDVQEMPYEEPPRAHGAVHSSPGWNAPLIVPRDDDLRRAADLLNAGRRVAMLVGQGAKHATDEILAVADQLGAGVAKALNGRAAVPDDVPYVTGSIGLLGTRPSDDMMQNCDTLLMVGTSFPYSEWLPEVGQARAVQIDIDPRARRAARARTRGSRRAARALANYQARGLPNLSMRYQRRHRPGEHRLRQAHDHAAPAPRGRAGHPHHRPLRAPHRRRAHGRAPRRQRLRRRPPDLGGAERLRHRRQRAADARRGQPGADDHGRVLAHRRRARVQTARASASPAGPERVRRLT